MIALKKLEKVTSVNDLYNIRFITSMHNFKHVIIPI